MEKRRRALSASSSFSVSSSVLCLGSSEDPLHRLPEAACRLQHTHTHTISVSVEFNHKHKSERLSLAVGLFKVVGGLMGGFGKGEEETWEGLDDDLIHGGAACSGYHGNQRGGGNLPTSKSGCRVRVSGATRQPN